jgi:hypothetical protein
VVAIQLVLQARDIPQSAQACSSSAATASGVSDTWPKSITGMREDGMGGKLWPAAGICGIRWRPAGLSEAVLVAGGLSRSTEYHAQVVSLLALLLWRERSIVHATLQASWTRL